MRLPQVFRRRTDGFSTPGKTSMRRAAFAAMLAAGVLALCATMAGQLPARAATAGDSSAGGFAAAATPNQNKVLDAVMARIAGGTRVSASEVEWDSGRLVVGVSAAHLTAAQDLLAPDSTTEGLTGYAPGDGLGSPLDCENGYFCAWSSPNDIGACWMYMSGQEEGQEFDWAAFSGTYCGNAGTWSWQNNTDQRVWKEQSFSGYTYYSDYFATGGTASGNSWCINPAVGNTDVTDSISRELGWIQMTYNTSQC